MNRALHRLHVFSLKQRARALVALMRALRLTLGFLLCSQEALSLRVPPPRSQAGQHVSRRRWLAGAGAAAAASAVPALAAPVLTRAPGSLRTVPYVPASSVLYVPEAQDSLPRGATHCTHACVSSLASVSPQANAAPSFVSSLQGPVQDAVAPAHWIGQLVGINSKTEEWAFADSSPAEVYRGAGSNPDPKP